MENNYKLDLYINYWEKERVRLYDLKEKSKSLHPQFKYDTVCLFLAHLKEIKDYGDYI